MSNTECHSPRSRRGSITNALETNKITHTLAEYVWIDGSMGLRSKTKVLTSYNPVLGVAGLPIWNFDGSSTGQAPGDDSEVLIRPVRVFKDPFRSPGNILVMCECLAPKDLAAIPTNTRAAAVARFDQDLECKPWFGIEQEYTLFKNGVPLGWPTTPVRSFGGPCIQVGYPGPQGPYYCSAGADVAFGRDLVEAHLKACLFAGITVSGINAEVMPGQWEYQVGPCEGIASGDHLWMSRYILHRVAETYDVVVSFDPKPIPGDWNGAGCHTNYSTVAMREEEGAFERHIIPAIEKLGLRHQVHIQAYGEGNEKRLTGAHETASIEKFSWGVANRGASVRVGNDTKREGKGYFEDRRPASNMDPYLVTSLIFETTQLWDGSDAVAANGGGCERADRAVAAPPAAPAATAAN